VGHNHGPLPAVKDTMIVEPKLRIFWNKA